MPESNVAMRQKEETVRWRRGGRDHMGEFSTYLVKELDRSPETAKNYLWSLKCLERFTGKSIEAVTATELRQFKRSDYAPATKQGVVVALHQFHKWGALEGYWSRNGILDVVTPRTEFKPRPPVSQEVARKLIENARTPLEVRVVYGGLYAGLRVSGSTQLDEDRWRGDRLRVKEKGKERTIPAHPELQKVKDEILSQQPASTGVLHSVLARMRDRIDVWDVEGGRVRPHTLRRTFGSTLYAQGVPWEIVRKLLGHGQETTDLYVKIPMERLIEAVHSLRYWEPQPVQLAFF